LNQITRNLRLGVAVAGAAASVGAMSGVAAQAAPIGAFTTKGAYSFVSAPRLHPPKIRADKPTQSKKLAPGYFLIGNFKNLEESAAMVGEGGPLILDNKLQPVWFNPVGTNVVMGNLRTQTYNGKPALSWWQGVISSVGATVSGEDVVVDQHYRQVATLKGDVKDGWVLSEHDMVINGHFAWVTAYRNVPANLTSFGGLANGIVTDSAVQEYDLKTGKLVFSWDALNPGGTPNVPLSDSAARPSPVAGPTGAIPWDAYHLNSIQLVGKNEFLASMRNTWAAYLVNITTGAVVWKLGGKPGTPTTFTIPASAQFQFQHDVELHSGNQVSLYDDACCAIKGAVNGVAQFAPPIGPSRGLVLKLNLATHTATQVAQYSRGSKFNAAFLGNTDLLPNGNVVIGWGSQPFFTEESAAGKVLLDAVLPGPNLSYRAFKSNWVGLPFFPPSGAVRNKKGKSVVYASWDGATRLSGWKVLAGPNAKHLTAVATRAKSGFETAIGLGAKFKSFKVQALDAKGHVIGTSKAFSVPKPGSSSTGPGFY
jgi:hypothetical protein